MAETFDEKLNHWQTLCKSPQKEEAESFYWKEVFLKIYQRAKERSAKDYQKEPLPTKLGFMNAYQLLFAFQDPMVKSQNPNWVKGMAQLRNKSILAHGTLVFLKKNFKVFTGAFYHFWSILLPNIATEVK